MFGRRFEILINFGHLQENISLSMLKNLMRAPGKIQNLKSLNKKQWGQRRLDESEKKSQEKRKNP